MKTFFNDKALVNRIIYELPRHEAVHKYSKMTLVFENDRWNVIADVFPLKCEVACSLAEDENRVIHV
jgi:hypothetical protein